jgi:hypothetical protein
MIVVLDIDLNGTRPMASKRVARTMAISAAPDSILFVFAELKTCCQVKFDPSWLRVRRNYSQGTISQTGARSQTESAALRTAAWDEFGTRAQISTFPCEARQLIIIRVSLSTLWRDHTGSSISSRLDGAPRTTIIARNAAK